MSSGIFCRICFEFKRYNSLLIALIKAIKNFRSINLRWYKNIRPHDATSQKKYPCWYYNFSYCNQNNSFNLSRQMFSFKWFVNVALHRCAIVAKDLLNSVPGIANLSNHFLLSVFQITTETFVAFHTLPFVSTEKVAEWRSHQWKLPTTIPLCVKLSKPQTSLKLATRITIRLECE